MAIQSMWVHGHSAMIELNGLPRGSTEDVLARPGTALLGLRYGWGVVYRCQANSAYWFHFAIPTPVVDDGVRAHLRRVTVLFTADAGVTLSSVHVWDSDRRVFAQDGLAAGGVKTSPVNGQNSFALSDVAVQSAIGISVLFRFGAAANVTLHSAGIQFES